MLLTGTVRVNNTFRTFGLRNKYEVVLEQRQHHAALVTSRNDPQTTGREVYDALREQRQAHSGEGTGEYTGEYIAGFSTWIDGKVCFDALALRLNEIIVANGNHDAVVRAVTGED
jgi:hypothetical protein